MKFSYSLIKEFVPDVKGKRDVVETLTMKAFDSEDAGGDVIQVDISHNRYADASSHIGIAREYSAATGYKLREPKYEKTFPVRKNAISIKIEDNQSCLRYAAAEFAIGSGRKTPPNVTKALEACGLRALHPIVDILNFVMLETGQPLHAFDADKLSGGIVVRNAKKGEEILTIDGQKFKLGKDMLVIADEKKAQAIAGIKGGKDSEIDGKTRRILVEAANFDPVSIYKTSREFDLVTDASSRFAHGMSPYSVEKGIERVRALLEKYLDAKFLGAADMYKKPQGKRVIGFSLSKYENLIGAPVKKNEAIAILKNLGFTVSVSDNKNSDFLVEVPRERIDVAIFEDLVEEVVRLKGLNELKPTPPAFIIGKSGESEEIVIKDKARAILTALGFDEVYNYSFGNEYSETSYEIENPIAENKKYMRQSLVPGMLGNVELNSRFAEGIKIFEIGNVFDKKIGERAFLGVALRDRSGDAFLEVKGVIEHILTGLGISDASFIPAGIDLEITSGGKTLGVISILNGETAAAEIDIDKVLAVADSEYEYTPLPKYPATMRDISIETRKDTRISDALDAIYGSGAEHLRDVDLIDYYSPRRLTFRIIFMSKNRTLTDKEVSVEMGKIEKAIRETLGAEMR